jgi:hypothetical protein
VIYTLWFKTNKPFPNQAGVSTFGWPFDTPLIEWPFTPVGEVAFTSPDEELGPDPDADTMPPFLSSSPSSS